MVKSDSKIRVLPTSPEILDSSDSGMHNDAEMVIVRSKPNLTDSGFGSGALDSDMAKDSNANLPTLTRIFEKEHLGRQDEPLLGKSKASSASNSNLEALADGARALAAFLRPYPMKTCGIPVLLSFDYASKSRKFRFVFRNSESIVSKRVGCGTEIFLPSLHFGRPINDLLDMSKKNEDTTPVPAEISDQNMTSAGKYFEVTCSDGSWIYDSRTQILHYFHDNLKGMGAHRSVQSSDGVLSGEGLHEIEVQVLSPKQVLRRYKPNDRPSTGSSRLCTIL
jgi:hypothetical protein